MGRFNSSLTRVQPVFGQLLDRDPSGRSWLPALLHAAPESRRIEPAVRADPGDLISEVAAEHPEGKASRACFEHAARPSRELLRWTIENAGKLRWPAGSAGDFSETTTEKRRALIAGVPHVRAEPLSELDRLGPDGSGRRWWSFEGTSRVDCWLETDRLVLFVEGKRTETLSSATSWLPGRDQLTRNLDVVDSASEGKPGFVLLAVETPLPEPTDDQLRSAAPHLGDRAAEVLRSRYLGQLTWREICSATDLDFRDLPDEV